VATFTPLLPASVRISVNAAVRSSNSNLEERQRRGYELRTGFTWAEIGGRPTVRHADINSPDGSQLASLDYGHTATLTLINLGWAMRKEKVETGFLLDLDQGRWQARPGDDDPDDPMSARVKRVIPFVEDRRNTLVFTPSLIAANAIERDGFMASLEAALKHAVQAVYDIEDVELAVAALPNRKKRTSLLLYEAAEGGAGVLRHLAEEPAALERVALKALEICHFDPETGEDRRRAPGALEDCEAACYDCLMSYTNQPDHPVLDRVVLKDYLLSLAGGVVHASPAQGARGDHLEQLMNLTQSDLERRWLALVHDHDYRLPDSAQKLMDTIGCRPDFLRSVSSATATSTMHSCSPAGPVSASTLTTPKAGPRSSSAIPQPLGRERDRARRRHARSGAPTRLGRPPGLRRGAAAPAPCRRLRG
jgi:hypothetical protein